MAIRKVIAFLGINPRDAVYVWKDKTYPARVMAQAIREFAQFDQMLVFVTPGARETFRILAELQDERIKPVDIVDGKDTESMWQIFQTVVDNVQEGETVIFDLTHGFRSLPFLAFLFIAYLKSAKNVTIEAVYYGAWEMKKDDVTPVLDLSQFVTMLDWITGTDQFVQTGNAKQLARLLNPKELPSGVLFNSSDTLKTISQAALLCQPFTLMQEVGKLDDSLKMAEVELNINAKPFSILRDKIVSAYSQFEDDGRDALHQLNTEFQLVEWYYQKGQLIQAVTLAREWLIDAVTYRLGEPLDFLLEKRKPFEEAISGIALIGKMHPQEKDRTFTENDLNRFGVTVNSWDDRDLLKQLWTDLKNVRNPLDHGEHQRKKEKEKTLEALNKKIQSKMEDQIMPSLRKVAKNWSIL